MVFCYYCYLLLFLIIKNMGYLRQGCGNQNGQGMYKENGGIKVSF